MYSFEEITRGNEWLKPAAFWRPADEIVSSLRALCEEDEDAELAPTPIGPTALTGACAALAL